MTTEEPMLEACPWCAGNDIKKNDNGHEEWLECAKCGATGPWIEPPEGHCFTGTELADQWNTRFSRTPPVDQDEVERVARLRELVGYLDAVEQTCFVIGGRRIYTDDLRPTLASIGSGAGDVREALEECVDKLWVLHFSLKDDAEREAAMTAINMANAALSTDTGSGG